LTAFKSEINPMFRSKFSEDIFNQKYRHTGCETWERLSNVIVDDVCGCIGDPCDPSTPHKQQLISHDEMALLKKFIKELKFIPGGRYLYYAGRSRKFYNNCYLLRAEHDTREDWADLSWKSESCLMTGGGIGIDYSVYRMSNSILSGTGGFASGPIPKMLMINEIGRNVMQGGSRRSAIYASLNWQHGDVDKFLTSKNWDEIMVPGTKLSLADVKSVDQNWPAPLDMTNISVNYDTDWYLNFCKTGDPGEIFRKNVLQAVSTAEPGFSFNFFDQEKDTLRNACTEVLSGDDSDVCNLGSINMGRIESIDEFKTILELATKFLVCGTLRADLPYDKIRLVREKNRRLGLGLMGIHEWLLKRGYRYEVPPELHSWLQFYRGVTNRVSNEFADKLGISRPIARRAIAPTGTIGILGGTTTGIEPIFAVAYKRRYLKEGTKWHWQYVVDSTAQELISMYGLEPEKVETALDLAVDYERRMQVQADIQQYVDQAISSTINLPKWGNRYNSPDTVEDFAMTLAKYAPRLRGFTCYPDGARGGQPLSSVDYKEAVANLGAEFEEAIETNDICTLTGHGGVCGV
jgi:ribonucleoside-diphosphate reductase alpha chain